MADDDEALRALLLRTRTVAVVGLSERPERDSNEIARYLLAHGYEVVPVNPSVPRVLGRTSYPSIAAIPATVKVDLVDVFRRSDQVPPVVDEAIARGVPAVWLQLGVVHPEATARARSAGLTVVEDRCIMIEHRRLGVARPPAA